MATTVAKNIKVGGYKLSWQVRHWPMRTGEEGLKGLSIEVSPIGIEGRRLVLEFPAPSVYTHRMEPGRSRPKVSSKEVATIVEAALAAGWLPTTRGKPFVFQLEASKKSPERPRAR